MVPPPGGNYREYTHHIYMVKGQFNSLHLSH